MATRDDSTYILVHDSITDHPKIEGLSDAVLIAGGVAKGVDLSPLASAAPSLAGVVAIGEASSAIVAIFEGLTPVVRAGSTAYTRPSCCLAAQPGSSTRYSTAPRPAVPRWPGRPG